MDSGKELEFTCLVSQITFLAMSTDWKSKQESELLSLVTQLLSACCVDSEFVSKKVMDLIEQIRTFKPKLEIVSLIHQIEILMIYKKLDSKWNLISLISQIIFLVSSMDLDSQPKPESKLISLIKQMISLLRSNTDSESELLSLTTKVMGLDISIDSGSEPTQYFELLSLIRRLFSLKPESELTSLIFKITSHFRSMNWEPKPLLSSCPQVTVKLEKGKFFVRPEVQGCKNKKGTCRLELIGFIRSTKKDHFHCPDCNGEYHEEYEQTPHEVRHLLHSKHSLRLVMFEWDSGTMECYCCDENLERVFYYCPTCNFAMNIACVEKSPILSIEHPKWHEHALALFPRKASLTCDLCALADSSCPFYICPPCDFVIHQNCIRLPRVIRISRHPHRISFTPSFDQGDWSCNICRKKIDNDYGGYSCIKNSCLYVAHSRCATQSNVWDGEELEGVPEEIEEEEVEPFVRISDGIIQHFSHQHHHLRLEKDTGRDYDENKKCRACITLINSGNFYSCMQCDFILHEECAKLSQKMHHPIHPHVLTLVTANITRINFFDKCSACPWLCTGFFYECSKEGCRFKLHVQCATISEPLIHGSHMHPLFLTSKPGETRRCYLCKMLAPLNKNETFNCIECDFALCFKCAILPEKVRYKHDKHMLALCYGEETSTMIYWCEACEKKIDVKERFYKCDEYCCVTIHIACLMESDFYMKPGLKMIDSNFTDIDVVPKKHRMSRPICKNCKQHCSHEIVFKYSGFIYCTRSCVLGYIFKNLR